MHSLKIDIMQTFVVATASAKAGHEIAISVMASSTLGVALLAAVESVTALDAHATASASQETRSAVARAVYWVAGASISAIAPLAATGAESTLLARPVALQSLPT